MFAAKELYAELVALSYRERDGNYWLENAWMLVATY
jgi:hypothetical protein